jgi:hypothetical protein
MRIAQIGLVLALVSLQSACSNSGGFRSLGTTTPKALSSTATEADRESTIWEAFNSNVSMTSVKVNRYIWQASLEVLDFMPIERIDPFSGIIVMGFGTPPGGRTAYRATVHVSEPALDARTLRVALATRNGPASAETMRALEDAILSRARQIRRDDGRL